MTDNQIKIKLPRLISDGMVLQRNSKIKVWGWAPPGEELIVRFIDQAGRTSANTKGEWCVWLDTGKEAGPCALVIETADGSETKVVKDILIGDVWLCSGQSNMQMQMESLRDTYPEEFSGEGNPYIRHFLVPEKYSFEALLTDYDSGSWEEVNADKLKQFTATGYFFAKSLYEKYKVPVGLINASLGGSPVQAWLSEEALGSFEEYYAVLQGYKDRACVEAIQKRDMAAVEAWYENINQKDAGKPENGRPCFSEDYDASAWPWITVPSYWEDEGLGQFNGVVWFRKEFELEAVVSDFGAKIIMGNIVDEDTVYINGIEIGTTPMQYIPRKYSIPQGMLKKGKNTVVVRVVNNSGKGGFYPAKQYSLYTGKKQIDLSGSWQYMIGSKSGTMSAPTLFQWAPSGLYNAMLAPAVSYAIKGFIWYQGESNTNKPQEYEGLFKALISDWRKKWGRGALPFLYVQLPNFMGVCDKPADSSWAQLREAQRRCLEVPGTGMAVAIDLGEWNDIHPVNKKDVGKRLSLAAQNTAYGESGVVASGPLFQKAYREGERLVVTFTSTGGGLAVPQGQEPGHFAIAGADRNFLWADACIKKDCVLVWNDRISEPLYVRYAWADNPEGANLYNAEGLPASPFTNE